MQILLFVLCAVVLLMAYKIWTIFTSTREDSLKISSLSNATWKKLLDRDTLSQYLPYHLYDETTGVYHNNNGTFGAVYCVTPRQYAAKQTADGFVEILSKMPDSVKLQVMLYGSHTDGGVIEAWESLHKTRGEKPNGYSSTEVRDVVHQIIDKMGAFYKSKFKEPVSSQMNYTLKDFRIYFSISSNSQEDLVSFKKILKDILEGNRFYPVTMHASELKMLLWEIFNSKHDLKDAEKYDSNRELNTQLIATDTEIDFTDDGCCFDGKHWINMSPMRYPEYASISDMGIKIGDYISNAMNTNQFRDNFIVTLSYFRHDNKRLSSVKRNHGIILSQSWNQNMFRKFNDVQKESISILDRIDVKKQSLFGVDMNVLVSGETQSIAQANAQTIASYWNKGGQTSSIVLAETKGIHQLAFLASLPMCANDEYFEATSKSRSMFSEQAAQFVPIECDWKGNSVPNIIAHSRRGQGAAFDMFVSHINYNGYVIAQSGAGKSVFLVLQAFLAYTRGDRVFILDYGASYKRICEFLGGQYIEPDRANPFSLNPFSAIHSLEQLNNELEFLATFIYGLGANKNKDEYEKDEKFFKSHLQEIIVQCYMEHGTALEVTDIKNALQAKGEELSSGRILDFCQQMRMFCRGGLYEEFFAGPCVVDFTSHFIVVEIQKIESDPDLRDAIIMMTTYHQSNAVFKKDGTTALRSLAIFDEAHKYIGKDPRMDDFIEQLYRRGRKEDNSTIIATQGFEDIYDSGTGTLSRAGKAIINSSSWKFYLNQSDTSINLLLKAGLFSFNDVDERLLRTTKTVLGEYSEVFIITPEEHKYVYRFILEKHFYYLTSSRPADRRRFNLKREQGLDVIGSIEAMIKEDEQRRAA